MELNAVCPTSGQSRAREGAGPQAHACGSVWLVARAWVSKKLSPETLACIFRHLTAEAHDRPAITSVRLLAVLNVGFKSVKGGVNLDHFGGAKVDQLVKG